MIDFHAHFGTLCREHYPQHPALSVHQLIDRMNREGIDISVLLPLESPEGSWVISSQSRSSRLATNTLND